MTAATLSPAQAPRSALPAGRSAPAWRRPGLAGSGAPACRGAPAAGRHLLAGSRALAAGRPAPRLTRRGRLAVAALIVTVALIVTAVLAAASSGAARAAAAGHGFLPPVNHRKAAVVVVRPGQTLWSLALRAQPGADPRVVVLEIMNLNSLRSSVIEPGQRLWVPGN
jgi:predicted Zn-dependent protease